MTKRAIIINDTTWENHIGCASVIMSIKQQCKKRQIDVVRTYQRSDIIHGYRAIQKSMNKIDIILVNGEGSLHHSPQWFGDLLKILPDNKACFLINTIWDKMFFSDVNLLNKFKLISVRESSSYNELLKTYSKPEKISIVPDLIFGLDTVNKNLARNEHGFGDSVLYSLREYLSSFDNYFPLNYQDKKIDAQEYIDWLRSLNLYITGRFHGVCLSIMAETNFFAFPSNSHKIEGILKDLNCEELLIHSLNDTKKINKDKNYIEIFRKYQTNAKEKINTFFDKVAEVAF